MGILAWAKPTKGTESGLLIKDEKCRRRKVKVTPKKKKGKKQAPSVTHIYWTYIERVAEIGGVREDTHNFLSLGEFLNHKKGAITTSSSKKKKKGGANIKNPIMYGSAYQTFGVEMSSSELDKARRTQKEVDDIDLTSFGDDL